MGTKRNDYISDNLVRISDRLRQNAAGQSLPKRVEEESRIADVAPKPLTQSPAPLDSVARREQDNQRALSELAARMARDCSELAVEMEMLGEKLRKLETLKQQYDKQFAELQAITPEEHGTMFGRTVDLARVEYFRLCGRREALDGKEADVALRPVAGGGHSLSLRELCIASLIPAVAIVLAGAVVALALAMVFRG